MKTVRQISSAGVELIKKLEGCSPYVYEDQGGYPTIGIGHLLTRTENVTGKICINGEPVYYQHGLTEQQCIGLLKQDLAVPVDTVNEAVLVPLNQTQFDALVSFVFNIGCGNFKKSTLLRVLNSGRYEKVSEQMRLWAYVKENVSKGLQRRREAEIKLWNRPAREESAAMYRFLPIDFIDLPESRFPWHKRILQLFKSRLP